MAAALTIVLFQSRAGFRQWSVQLKRWRQTGYLYLLVFLGPLAVSAVIVAVGYGLGILSFEPSNIHVIRFVVFKCFRFP